MQIKEPVLVKEDFYGFISREDQRACHTMQDRGGMRGSTRARWEGGSRSERNPSLSLYWVSLGKARRGEQE